MQSERIMKQFERLPPDGQKKVATFIALVKARYQSFHPLKRSHKINWTKERFVGMWKDREEMKDGVTWVREVRKQEWGK